LFGNGLLICADLQQDHTPAPENGIFTPLVRSTRTPLP
jgi:hypothetical protein